MMFCSALCAGTLQAQSIHDRIVSEHVRIRIPVELEWLGREAIPELERCYVFVDGVVNGKLPRRILVDILWDDASSFVDPRVARVKIGMAHPAAAASMRTFLIHGAAREIARMGLLAMGKAAAPREGSEFLYEGMAEVMAHEFRQTSRKLSGAWVLARMLDRLGRLGIKAQSSWPSFSGGRHDLAAAAPGATFILACREEHGRERTLKLFENLGRRSLAEALSSALRTRPDAIEESWLRKVREFSPDLNANPGGIDALKPERTAYQPAAARPGQSIQIRFYMPRGASSLLPEGLFLEEGGGRVLAAASGREGDAAFLFFDIPVETGRKPGSYPFRCLAVDYFGNLGSWSGSYSVAP